MAQKTGAQIGKRAFYSTASYFLVIALLLFGVGRIEKKANELGSGIHSFREGLGGDKEEKLE